MASQLFQMDHHLARGIDDAALLQPTRLIDSKVYIPSEVQKSENFRLLSINARSINNKLDQLRRLATQLEPTFLLVQETWGKNPTTDYSINGYVKPEFNVRSSDNLHAGGGVAIWPRHGTSYQVLKSPFIPKVIESITLCCSKPNIIIINVYCPFEDKQNFVIELDKHIKDMKQKHPNHGFIIAGDFNMNISQPDQVTEDLTDMMTNHGLLQQVTESTRVTDTTSTLIDHVYTRLSSTAYTDVIITDLADHYGTLTTINSKQKSRKNITATKRWFTKAAYDALEAMLRDQTWPHDEPDIHSKAQLTHAIITSYIDAHIPVESRTINRNKFNPWTTPGLLISMKTCEKLYRKAKKDNTWADRHKEYKKVLGKVIDKAKDMHYRECFDAAGTDSRKVWGILNEVIDRKQLRHTIPDTMKSGNIPVADKKQIANLFNHYFASIGTEMANSLPDTPGYESYLPTHACEPLQLEEVTQEAVMMIMKKQKPKLSAGIDSINNKIVKQCHEHLASIMTNIINHSIRTSTVPNIHKQALIKPLFKKGDDSVCGNYRPVSLLPSLSKILEKVVNKQLVHHLETKGLLTPNQFGFRPKNQTTHVVHQLLNIISDAAQQKEVIFVTYIDLSKAFDCLQYDKLLVKMKHLQISDKTINWFKNYLTNRKQCVQIDQVKSDWKDVQLGVPQGSILGPILFLIYMNDIPMSALEAIFLLFADDTSIVATGKTEKEAAEKMNQILQKVELWFVQNKLHLNPSKTRYQIFNCDTNQSNHLSINGVSIQRAWSKGNEKTFKLVGLHIDEKLTWQGHIETLVRKINYALYGMSRARNTLSTSTKKLLYHGLIHSHLTYGVAIWGSATQGRLHPLFLKQKRAIRLIFTLPSREHTLPYYIKLDILQLPELIYQSTLCYIHGGTHETSPPNVRSLWIIRHQARNDLRERGLILDLPVTHMALVNHLPRVTHSKIWNNSNMSPSDKTLSIPTFKKQSKNELLLLYLDNLSLEEQAIALKLDLLNEEDI